MKVDRFPIMHGLIRTTRHRANDPKKPGWRRDPKTGLWVRSTFNHNIIVLGGLSFMFKSIQYGHAEQGGSISQLAVGTGGTIPTKADTDLETLLEIGAIDSWDNTLINSDPVSMTATKMFLTTQANGNLMECGLFEDASSGTMFCRGLFNYGELSGATNESPVTILTPNHGLADGELVTFSEVPGMTDLNGNSYYVNVLSDSIFALFMDDTLFIPVDGTDSAWGTFDSGASVGGYWKVVVPKTDAEILTINYTLEHPAD